MTLINTRHFALVVKSYQNDSDVHLEAKSINSQSLDTKVCSKLTIKIPNLRFGVLSIDVEQISHIVL